VQRLRKTKQAATEESGGGAVANAASPFERRATRGRDCRPVKVELMGKAVAKVATVLWDAL
jgi:hypothetical protein